MDERQPIRTALARSGGQPLRIPVDLSELYGGVVVYEFVPSAGTVLVDLMDQIATEARKDAGGGMKTQIALFRQVLEVAAHGDTRDRIGPDIDEGRLDVGSIMELGKEVIRELTGANPTSRSDLPPGSPEPGEPSTPGALPAPASTPPPSR